MAFVDAHSALDKHVSYSWHKSSSSQQLLCESQKEDSLHVTG